MNPSAEEVVQNGIRIYDSDTLDIWLYEDSLYEMIYTSNYDELHLPMTYNRYRDGHPKFNELMEKYT